MLHHQQDLPPNVVLEDGPAPKKNPESSAPIQAPVKLPLVLPLHCTWTNDAAQLELATYFDPAKPNLASDFGIAGLQPVIRQVDGDVFLLQDAKGLFYEWCAWEGGMWRLDGLTGIQEAVDAVMKNSGILEKTQIWREGTF